MRIRNNKVNVFLSDNEKFILKRDSSRLNLSQSEYIRNLIIGYKIKFPEVKEEPKPKKEEYIIENIVKALEENIECLIKKEADTEFILVCDITGGSVFNVLLQLCVNKNVYEPKAKSAV